MGLWSLLVCNAFSLDFGLYQSLFVIVLSFLWDVYGSVSFILLLICASTKWLCPAIEVCAYMLISSNKKENALLLRYIVYELWRDRCASLLRIVFVYCLVRWCMSYSCLLLYFWWWRLYFWHVGIIVHCCASDLYL